MPLITPLEDVLAVAPQAAAQPASAEREQPGTLDTLAAAFRQNSSVSTLYERFANEQSLPFQKNFAIPRAEGYDPYEEVTDFADDPDALRVLMRAESPEELQFLKDRVRRERSDRQTIAEAGGWGLASSLAAGITDPILLASMAIPLAPALTGVGRVGRVAAGVAATAAVDSAAEAVLHSGQELRTVGESAFNVGAGVLLSSVLGGIVTRIPKGELDVVRRELQAEIARANGVEMPAVNQAGEGADSFGAARAVGTSLEDEGIARGGQTIAKTLGRISPLTRTLQSPFKSARVLAQKLVDVPYMLTKNLRGKATPASVERAVKRLVNLGRYHATKVLDESFLEYKRSGGTLARKQFSQEVATALTRADVSPISQVAKAVSWARKTFNDDKALFKDLGVEFGDEVVGAPSYFPRVYQFERIINNRADFNRRLANWFQQNPKMKVTKNADGSETVEPIILSPAEIQDAVMKTVDRILGLPTSRADLNLRSKGAPLKERSLDVPDEILAPYLERDFEMVVGGYFRAVAPEIEMRRMGLSSPALETELGELTDEYHRLLAKNVDNNAKTQELTKAYEQSMNDLMLLRDRLMGNVGTKGGKHVGWIRAARIARTYNYVRLLGAQMLSSMSDYGRLVARYGLTKTVGGTAKFLLDWNLNKLTRESAHRFGTALEMVLDSRSATLAEIGEELPRTRFDQGMQWASNQFSRWSLMSPWNATIKSLATLLEQDEIARALKRQSKFDKARLSAAGFEDSEYATLRSMIDQHAETTDGVMRLRTELWQDQELARKVEDSITKVADEIVITKGFGDLPKFMDSETWKTLLQFRSFAMASVNRTMIPMAQGLVNGDLARTAQGLGSMLSLGMLVYYAKEFAAGREPNVEPDRLVAEAFNWSGLMGIIPDLWDPIAAYSPEDEDGENILPRFSRFKSRSPMESLLGPTFGTGLDTVLGSLGGFADGTLEQKDVERFRRLLPAQNLFYVRRLFNAIEGEMGEITGAEGATTEDFVDRITDEVPAK
jgi:hypothetical protein